MTTVRIYIEPVPAARPRVTRNGTYTPVKYAQFKMEAKYRFRKFWGNEPLEGPLSVNVFFAVVKPLKVKRRYPSVRPDLDNLMKAVFDSANEVIWKDDCQIVKVTAEKAYVENNPYIELSIDTIEE